MGMKIQAVSMYTKLKASKIHAILTKIRKNKSIFDQPNRRREKLKRQHFSFFLDMMWLPKYNLMTIKELKEVFILRFGLENNFITISGLRKALKRKIKLK
jgi:hypothetical protein